MVPTVSVITGFDCSNKKNLGKKRVDNFTVKIVGAHVRMSSHLD